MKKIIFSTCFLAAGLIVFAQDEPVKVTTSVSYPAYSAPAVIRMNFQTANPDVTVVSWEPVNDLWRASFNTNNRMMYTFYSPRGETYNLALPVLEGFIPENVITSAINLYGSKLYSITRMKPVESMELFTVRSLENNEFIQHWLDINGADVTDTYKIKIEDDKMKIKSE